MKYRNYLTKKKGKLDKVFMKRLVEFNEFFKEKLNKAESLMKQYKEVVRSENPKEIKILDKKLGESLEFIKTGMKAFQVKERKNFKRLDRWLEENKK